jgi:hypothetical protein
MNDTNIDSNTDPEPMRILRIATCPSISGRSELTYHVGCNRNEHNAIHFRLWANTAAGMFSNTWFSLQEVSNLLSGEISSSALHPLWQSTSRNNPGFTLAVLRNEGLIEAAADWKYRATDPAPFLERINALIASDVNLNEEDVPEEMPAEVPTAKRGRPRKS